MAAPFAVSFWAMAVTGVLVIVVWVVWCPHDPGMASAAMLGVAAGFLTVARVARS